MPGSSRSPYRGSWKVAQATPTLHPAPADAPGLLLVQAATTMATIGKIAANLRIDTVGLLLLEFDYRLIGGIFDIGEL
jgi:hypothetical protein